MIRFREDEVNNKLINFSYLLIIDIQGRRLVELVVNSRYSIKKLNNFEILGERILKTVERLRSRGIRCYLSTNNEKYRVQYLLDKVGLKNFFDGAFSSAQIGYKKPQQEFWSVVYKQIGVPEKSEIVVWDDDQENIESAKSFGFVSEVYSDFDSYKSRMKSLVG